jgi:DNA polymerase-3 subunit alpha
MPKWSFDCGCCFDIIGSSGDKHKLVFSPKIESINLSCSKTWDLISSGNTKGCFQLESRLGQMMAKKLKPENIEQLSGLISILRPGCLEAIRDGKSVTNHYIDKKNGLESINYFHESLERSLSTTYGEMIYQEQAMSIAKDLAGFDLQEADSLRKAIGKKKPEEMAKVKQKFLDGAKKLGVVNIQEAEEIFGWIEKSQRYSFNKSHGISYAMNAYLSAYAKAHFPEAFFVSYLKFAKDKIDPQQEIKELIKNANEMDILVCLPDLRLKNPNFGIFNNKIYFGLTDIKGVGDSVFSKITDICMNIDLYSLGWMDLLLKLLLNINSIAAKALISSGAIDYVSKNRAEMLFELEIISSLTKKEIEYATIVTQTKTSTKEMLTYLLNHNKVNVKRKQIIQSLLQSVNKPPYSLIDKIEWLADTEASLLGTAISCSKLDSYDIEMTNVDCKTFKTSNNAANIIIAGEITNINVVKTKKGKLPGQEMSFVSIEDQTGALDSVIFFPETYAKYKHYLFENNILIFIGNKSKTKDGLVVDKCFVPKS